MSDCHWSGNWATCGIFGPDQSIQRLLKFVSIAFGMELFIGESGVWTCCRTVDDRWDAATWTENRTKLRFLTSSLLLLSIASIRYIRAWLGYPNP